MHHVLEVIASSNFWFGVTVTCFLNLAILEYRARKYSDPVEPVRYRPQVETR